MPQRIDVGDRLFPRVTETASGCWEWGGYIDPLGYGRIRIDGVSDRVHRAAYRLVVGVIPDGLELDHLCRNRKCCNPAHLEPVTRQENCRRAAAIKTHCPSGHEYTPENTRYGRSHDRPGRDRRCKACAREYRRRRKAEG